MSTPSAHPVATQVSDTSFESIDPSKRARASNEILAFREIQERS